MKALYLSLNPPSALEIHLRVNVKRESGVVSDSPELRRLLNQLEGRLDQAFGQPVCEHLGTNDSRSIQPSGVTKLPVSPNTH